MTDDESQTNDTQADYTALRYVIGTTAQQTIHAATCIREYLTEVLRECEGGDDNDNQRYGRWLLDTIIDGLLRDGLAQLDDEDNRAKHNGVA